MKGQKVYRCDKCLNEYTKAFESCPMCGGKLIFFDEPLNPSDVKQREEQERLKQLKEHSNDVIKNEIDRVSKEVNLGKKLFLYRSFYMSVDSEMDAANEKRKLSPYDDSRVKEAGLFGWRIVGVVPRTSGSALQNYEGFGKAWAGGIGGNIIGSYIMMEYELNRENLESSKDLLIDTIKESYKLI